MNMKTIFNNEMVAHVWAQQNQPEGRSSNGQFYFRGKTIYSYRDSYPLATFVTNSEGAKAVLFRPDCYSNSTAKHISHARRALHGVQVFFVTSGFGSMAPDHKLNKERYQGVIKAECEKAVRARKNAQWYMDTAVRAAEEANQYAEFFGLHWRLAMPEFSAEFIAEVKAKAAKEAKAKAAATKKREAMLRAQMAESAAKWLAGEGISLDWRQPDTFLRIQDDEVQTSRGARVPVEHARRLWPIIQRVMASGTAYVRNGHSEHVGHFAVDRIEVNGDLRIGCHNIKFAEVARIAGLLGLS